MTALAIQFAQAAKGLVGVAFRLHGRNPQTGLDCVGLVSASLSASGVVVPPLPEYGLRNSNYSSVIQIAEAAGFEIAIGPFVAGDLVIVTPGPAQLHFLIADGANHFIHAQASLRKVVAMPGPIPWPIWSILRLTEKV